MLRFVSKKDYWRVLDDGIMEGVAPTSLWHLKDIQDAIAMSHMYNAKGLDIAEIGAGHSRLIEMLAKNNSCTAIDEYKGVGGGPKSQPEFGNVRFVDCMVGNSQGLIPEAGFDILFSISVVEHVPTPELPSFFDDCHRILRPGGIMIHMIDAYVENDSAGNLDLWNRVSEYIRPLKSGKFQAVGSIDLNSLDDLVFNTSFATNPDNVMRQWNKSAPTLVEKRARAQSCTIEMVAHRI